MILACLDTYGLPCICVVQHVPPCKLYLSEFVVCFVQFCKILQLSHLHDLSLVRSVNLMYLDPNEMSGRSYLCTCPQTILLSEKENRISTLLTHR